MVPFGEMLGDCLSSKKSGEDRTVRFLLVYISGQCYQSSFFGS